MIDLSGDGSVGVSKLDCSGRGGVEAAHQALSSVDDRQMNGGARSGEPQDPLGGRAPDASQAVIIDGRVVFEQGDGRRHVAPHVCGLGLADDL